jgi:hypothetical protein
VPGAPDRPAADDTHREGERKLIVSNLISWDGYASGRDGDVMALPFDTTFSDCNLDLMQAADNIAWHALEVLDYDLAGEFVHGPHRLRLPRRPIGGI